MERNIQAQLLLVWIFSLSLIPSSASAQRTQPLAKQVHEILKTNCHRCHGQDGTVEGGINYILDLKTLVNRKKVVPKDPKNSTLLQRIQSGEMPPPDEAPRPSAKDIDLIKDWIQAGASDFSEEKPRVFIKADEVFKSMRQDLLGLSERDRIFARYFTITHLHNAGISEDELQTYRNGLSKLVNSLSWGRKIIRPRPIDSAKTVLRIDLRDFKWTEKTWEAIVGASPYGVIYNTQTAKACYEWTGTRVPLIRADWFVAAASHPPLYHLVLEMPSSDGDLEKQLKVDVEADIHSERVVRAAFNGSGVSRNNRLIERHESSYGAYWKSYDFGSNAGRKNLFAHPLGPGKDSTSFDHDGGEIIFNLPNGLQAYLLVDAKGNRIDKGPTAIVSDAKRPDKAVENGISCMSCHSKGMIEKNDQIRDHVQKNVAGFNKTESGTILALYPSKETLLSYFKEDANRFQRAVAETGDRVSATESIVALTLRFESELDLALASAEVGLPPDEFNKELARIPALARTLGILNVDGGTVQRDVFVADFGEIVRALKFGTYVPKTDAVNAGSQQQSEISLLDGNTLDVWEPIPAGEKSEWSLNNGILRLNATGPSLATKQNFSDFDLHLEFKLPSKCNSGVYLRGRYEIQLLDSDYRSKDGKPAGSKASTGAIWGLIAPSKNTYRGPNKWNTMDVRLVGRVVTVRMNDAVIIDSQRITGVTGGAFNNDESEPGPIVLQADAVPGLEFRNIRIKPISDDGGNKGTNGAEKANGDGWLPLFEAKDIKEWKAPVRPDCWVVAAKEITAKGPGQSHLYFNKLKATDFELRAEIKLAKGTNSGIFFRCDPGVTPNPSGYEVQLNCGHKDPAPSGSLYGLANADRERSVHDKWFKLHLIAKQNHIVIEIDDEVVVDFVDQQNRHKSGVFALQLHGQPQGIGVVHFRNIMFKALD